MKTVYPRLYPAFSCLGGKCRHSCCIGWEIDIDAESLERYRRLPGEMGERLRRGIVQEAEGAHFLLTEEERCPFLNSRGLCDMILAYGEDILCQVCADHPRFRNFFSDRTEIGLGLCCEAAGRLLLSAEAPFSLIEEGEEQPSGEEAALLSLREELFSILQCRALPLEERLGRLLRRCHAELADRDFAAWAEIYLSLERLDAAWTERLHALAGAEKAFVFPPEMEISLEQLACCLLYRHLAGALEDGNIQGRAALTVLSVRVIAAMLRQEESPSLDALIEISRLYSAEIEYSEENLQALMEAALG